MDEHDIKAKILYFCREKLYNCMLNACRDGINRFHDELSFKFYHGLALVLCDQIHEGIRQLETLRAEHDYRLAVVISLMYAYKIVGSTERELFQRLESQARELRKGSVYMDLYNTAIVLFAFKKYEKAYEYVEKALSIEPKITEILCLKGWIQLYLFQNDIRGFSKVSPIFELSMKDKNYNLDGCLGLAESLTYEKNYDEAMIILNKAIVRFPSINLGLIQKMKLYYTLQNWDQCLEIMNRVMVTESDNLEALKFKILILICNSGKYEEGAKLIEKFYEQLQKTEPKNSTLLYENAQLLARICGRNVSILQKASKMCEKALELLPNNVKFMSELAYQSFLQKNYKKAIHLYKSALKIDESFLDALMGITLCELMENGKSDKIKHQVDFLVELQGSNVSALILFLQSMFSKPDAAIKLLNEICQLQLNSVRDFPYGPLYLIRLDLDFLLNVSKELLTHIPQSPDLFTDKYFQKSSVVTQKVEGVLKKIVKACPGLHEALYLLSKVQLLNGDPAKAKNTLDEILANPDTTFSEAYLLMAQIHIYTEQFERAQQSLEIGLSYNFKVRENPLYHFISGVVEKKRHNLGEATKCFTTALNLINSKRDNLNENSNCNYQVSLADKASIYFELIDVHSRANQIHEAMKLIENAMEEFRGTSEEARIIILEAEQAVSRNDVQAAIDMLSKIQPSESYYLQAKTKLANIFLEYRKDAKAYLHCYQEMVNSEPGPESYILLGDAYLHILADKASIYFELIDVHSRANQIHEAMKLIENAMEEFRGTSEEARIIILEAEQAVSRNDVQAAIDMLSKIQPSESYYLQAKTKLANIFLEYRKDAKAYLHCYQEMVNSEPGPESYILLGDAYLHILEIEKALKAYEKALETNPQDQYLCSKMGRALVKTHYYSRAISYYKEAIKLTDSPELKLQLSDLYMKLQNYDKAELLLTSEIEMENAKTVEDLVTLRYKTKLMVMLSQIYEKLGNITAALKILRNARENQNRVMKRLSIDEADISEEETNSLKTICMKLSELAVAMKDNENAILFYKEALSIFPNNQPILINLAKLYMTMNNLELCQQTCAALLKVDPDNEEASVMMADIAFRKVDFDMASFHFTNLLSKQPTNWRALVRFIEVLRRTGELDELPQYLQQAELACGKANKNPGYCYCNALYQWYSGNLNAALRNFNNARLDLEWGKKAIYNMIEICLNPEDEMLGDQFFDSDDMEYRDSRSMALKTADRLLKELKQKSSGSEDEDFKYRLLSNFLLLASKEKSNVEQALEEFTNLASHENYKEEIGPILGIATAHTILKQGQRAKNQLKRVVKTVWTFEDAEYLERCWLLLADYYIQSSKYDLASELLKRVLQHNKACTKAYEFSGYIAEKEQAYKDAVNYYDSAWKFGGKTNPSVGYKLALNFMKCKRHAEAIDICQQVLKNHPDYPKIKKDILDKSLNNLRT